VDKKEKVMEQQTIKIYRLFMNSGTEVKSGGILIFTF